MSAGSPPPLGPSGRTVVRLNRRVIYIVGAALIIVVVTGLVAIRAQGTRLADRAPERRFAVPSRARAWFEEIPDHQLPDQTPIVPPAPIDPPRPSLKLPAADAERGDRQQRLLRAAMGAPITVATFERSSTRRAAPRPLGSEDLVARPGDTTPAPVAFRKPTSPYEVKAGTVIPAVLLSAINGDLPGPILGQVRENVYDSATGEHLLIPQGTRLIGLYDHRIVYGQQRLLITWSRLVFPDGSSLSLTDGMPGTDALGATGFHDQVDNHYVRLFGNALMLSVISAGFQLSQGPEFGRDVRGPTAGTVLGAATGQQLGSVSSELIRRGMSVAPTLEIRPGYAFNVMVTHDVTFPAPQ